MALTRPRAHQVSDSDYKQSVRVAQSSNVTLSGGAPATVDGISVSAKDRVLVLAQTDASQNGIYYVSVVGSGSNGTWIRATDADDQGDMTSGLTVKVTAGTAHDDTTYKLTTDDPITLGSTDLVFALASAFAFGQVNAGGTTLTADQVNDLLTLTAGTNVVVTGNSGTDTATIALSTAPTFTGNVTGGNLITTALTSTQHLTVLASGTVEFNDNRLRNVADPTSTQDAATKAYVDSALSSVVTISDGSNTQVLADGDTLTFAGTSNEVDVAVSATDTVTIGLPDAITISGNVTGGNLITGAQVVATANITGGNLITGAQVVATGNVTGGNIVTAAKAVSGTIETGAISVTNTSLDDSILITTTEASSTAGPVLTLKRNSSSVADGDYLGQIKFKGENDADQEVVYSKITGKILDASDGTEDGILEFAFTKGGSNNISARFRSDSLQLLNGTTLTVNGLISSASTITATSDIETTGGDVNIKARGETRFYDSDSSNYVALRAGATVASDIIFTLPTADGTSGQVIQTDGARNLSFVTASGGGGGASGFAQSTITTHPAASDDKSLGTGADNSTEETPFEAGGADAFGVSLGIVYDQMEPTGSTVSIDLGDSESHVGA